MSAVLRTWLGFIALGAGLVHLALTIGAPLPLAGVLLPIGAAEFAWGVFAVVRPEAPLPRLARAAAFVPVIGWALLLVVAGSDSLGPLTSPSRLLPMLVASLFDLLIAGILTVLLRRAAALHADADAAAAPRPNDPLAVAAAEPVSRGGRSLVATIAGALVIAALTAPALAATDAGQAAGGGTFTTGHDH